MGRKNKNKAKPVAPVVASEADAAAGLMTQAAATVVVVTDKKKDEAKDDNKKKHDSKRARDREDSGEEQQPLSRRQKRQKLNDKNKWPQHPKIMNPEKRAKAYLRVAGVEEIGDDDTEIPVQTEPVTKQKKKTKDDGDGDDDDEEWRRFGRFLGGTDARMRDKAVKRLGHYLQARSGFGQEDCSDVVGLSELDLMKLWKGLWYTLYMADKAPVQDELAKHLSKLIWCLTGSLEEDEQAGQAFLDWQAEEEMEMERRMAEAEDQGEDGNEDSDEDVKILDARYVEMDDGDSSEEEDSEEGQEKEGDSEEDEDDSEDDSEDVHEHKDGCCGSDDYDEDEKTIRGIPLVMLMFKTFYKTLVREWGNMDKYRVDKFYSLVRYMMREMYRYMALRQWNLGIIKLLNDTIFEEVLTTTPNGIRYHLIDIALEELSHVVHKTECLPMTEAIFLEVVEPFFLLAQHGAGDKSVQARAMENVLEKFLKQYSIVSEFDDDSAEQQQKTQILDEVHVGTVADFIFEMASDENTLDIHRKSLYDMHKQYKRQLKKIGKDVEMGNLQLDQVEQEMDEADEHAEHDKEMELENDDEDGDSEESEEEVQPAPKKSKKLRRKEENMQKKQKSGGEVATSDSKQEKKNKNKNKEKGDYELQMDWTRHGDGDDAVNQNSKKKKKNKKSKNKRHDTQEQEPEETLTISVSDQKKAKKALRKGQAVAKDEDNASSSRQSKKQKKKDKQKSDEDRKRRVSWGTKNQARSWKASMQGLKTMDPPKALLASKTPDKSILLNKGKKSPTNTSAVTQKQRKRAVDYF